MATTITCLVDDAQSGHKALTHQHGMSLHIVSKDISFLFDCGSTGALIQNAEWLGINLKQVDTVVLSHAHYDHTGGFRNVVGATGITKVITGNHFFVPKYSLAGIRHSYMGPNFSTAYLVEQNITHAVCDEVYPLGESCWVIGQFERTYPEESIPLRYSIRTPEGFVPDPFAEEVALAVRMDDGIALIVGCSHPGILNIIQTAESRLCLPVRGVWGGTHLIEATPERVHFTINALKGKGIRHLGFSHCSGEFVQELLSNDPWFSVSALRPGDGIDL